MTTKSSGRLSHSRRRKTTSAAPNTAIVYCRVSTFEQADSGVGIKDQEERLLAYCRAMGLEVVAVLRDVAGKPSEEKLVSGGTPIGDRPQGRVLLDMLAEGKASQVVALKLDRLFRNLADAVVQTREWDARSIGLHLVDMGGTAMSTSGPTGRMMLAMFAAFGEFERAMISERTKAALRAKKRSDNAYTSTPYGYDRIDTPAPVPTDPLRTSKQLIENPAEAEVIRDIVVRHARNESLYSIAKTLNDRGVLTKNPGRQWYPSTVKQILTESKLALRFKTNLSTDLAEAS